LLYDKEKIDFLYRKYVQNRDEKSLGDLIEACDPMIRIIANRTVGYVKFFKDLKQEIKLKMAKNFPENGKLEKYNKCPSAYLYFKIWTYMIMALRRFKRIYGIGNEIAFSEYDGGLYSKLVRMIQNEFMDPEKLFFAKTVIPAEMIKSAKKAREKHVQLSKYPELDKRIEEDIKQMFGVGFEER